MYMEEDMRDSYQSTPDLSRHREHAHFQELGGGGKELLLPPYCLGTRLSREAHARLLSTKGMKKAVALEYMREKYSV